MGKVSLKVQNKQNIMIHWTSLMGFHVNAWFGKRTSWRYVYETLSYYNEIIKDSKANFYF